MGAWLKGRGREMGGTSSTTVSCVTCEIKAERRGNRRSTAGTPGEGQPVRQGSRPQGREARLRVALSLSWRSAPQAGAKRKVSKGRETGLGTQAVTRPGPHTVPIGLRPWASLQEGLQGESLCLCCKAPEESQSRRGHGPCPRVWARERQ